MLSSTALLTAALVAVGALVVLVEGPGNLFSTWNVMPLVVAWVVLRRSAASPGSGGSDGRPGRAGAAFAVTVGAVEAAGHLAWRYDWGGTATRSSTAGLVFVVLPVVAMGAGAAAALAVRTSG